ncbi:MAG: hypothetical protein E7425_02225 [Ruminococcaceae bacterium]|nr:hypothetical protein [Oscillospiraceae bacterium]
MKRRSPYRNYLKTPVEQYENIVYLLVVDTDEAIAEGYEKLTAQPWSDAYRVMKGNSEFAGYSFMKIYDASVSRPAMLKELAAMLGTEKTVTFGLRSNNDHVLTNDDPDRMVRELRDSFEPVDFRCWKSIFRL